MLFDTHAHLNDEQFAEDLVDAIIRAESAGVTRIANVGCDIPSSERALEIAKEFPGCFAVVGVHPHDAQTLDIKALDRIESLLREPEAVALGEIGLDYYHDLSPRDVQQRAFREQIALAREMKKPVVIHDRDAHGDMMTILKEEKAGENGGILHCFSGSWEMAKECLAMGFYISFAGPLTFTNAGRLLEIARQVPSHRLLVETDCPYLTPHPFRGKRNEPARVRLVAEKLAQLRGLSLEEIADITTQNASRVYGI